jgi:hypothetical protein
MPAFGSWAGPQAAHTNWNNLRVHLAEGNMPPDYPLGPDSQGGARVGVEKPDDENSFLGSQVGDSGSAYAFSDSTGIKSDYQVMVFYLYDAPVPDAAQGSHDIYVSKDNYFDVARDLEDQTMSGLSFASSKGATPPPQYQDSKQIIVRAKFENQPEGKLRELAEAIVKWTKEKDNTGKADRWLSDICSFGWSEVTHEIDSTDYLVTPLSKGDQYDAKYVRGETAYVGSGTDVEKEMKKRFFDAAAKVRRPNSGSESLDVDEVERGLEDVLHAMYGSPVASEVLRVSLVNAPVHWTYNLTYHSHYWIQFNVGLYGTGEDSVYDLGESETRARVQVGDGGGGKRPLVTVPKPSGEQSWPVAVFNYSYTANSDSAAVGTH